MQISTSMFINNWRVVVDYTSGFLTRHLPLPTYLFLTPQKAILQFCWSKWIRYMNVQLVNIYCIVKLNFMIFHCLVTIWAVTASFGTIQYFTFCNKVINNEVFAYKLSFLIALIVFWELFCKTLSLFLFLSIFLSPSCFIDNFLFENFLTLEFDAGLSIWENVGKTTV